MSYLFEAIHPSEWNRNILQNILKSLEGKNILVLGDVGVDRYTIGLVERISPEAPVPIVLVQEEQLKLGLAANVADNVHALGGKAYLLGVIGEDRTAQDFQQLLKNKNISNEGLITDLNRRTALKERVVSDKQQLLRIDYESQHSIDLKIEEMILNNFEKILPSVDGIIVEDYAKGILTQRLMQRVLELARINKKPLVVDPHAKTPLSFYKGTKVLKPNLKEAEALSGIYIQNEEHLSQAGLKLLEITHAEHIVISRGKDGMAIFTRGSSMMQLIPTYAKEVYDVSGAGDTVISVLMLGLVSGASIQNAAILANLAAGVEVGKRGTATVSRDEILQSLDFYKKQNH